LLFQGSLKFHMERRWLVAKYFVQLSVTDWKNVGEPPTLHRLQVLQRFQAASGFVQKFLPILFPNIQRQPEMGGAGSTSRRRAIKKAA